MTVLFSKYKVKCVLFDLDGTLVTTGGAGARALERAFAELYGVAHAMKNIDPSGKTDPVIIREIFQDCLQRDCSRAEMESVQRGYLDKLENECARAEDYRVMDGIPEILDALKREKAVIGLGTGNLEKGARIKLNRSGLNPHLPFGGYGSDSEIRAELLKVGKRRAEELHGAGIDSADTFVVGDTHRDILAARKAGFPVIAVATGGASARDLQEHQPDYCLNDFKDVGRFLDIILGGETACA